MKRTFTTLHAAGIAPIAVALLGTASVGASASSSVRVAADQSPSATPILVILPTTVVTDPTVVVGPMTPTAESPAIARKEATAALAQAKRDCRRQPSAEQKSCLGAAQDDYRNKMPDSRSGNR